MIHFNSKLPHTGISIFSEMTRMANENNAINLSQGFPDFDCPAELTALVTQHMQQGHNQYAPMEGLVSLRERAAEKTRSLHNADYDPELEITVTAGATQAIFTVLTAVIQPSDEVIIFEPAYDSYAPAVKLLGGVVKQFELSPPDYEIDWSMVKRLVSVRTKMIIVNSPQNPIGRIINEEDIRELEAITRGTDILILSDEVYEHVIFDGRQHLSLARFPQLRERTFICVSFGKLFHNTGWKIGYCLAPVQLMKEFRKVHQYMVFSVNTPVQYALADFLKDKSHYLGLADFFQQKRDYFASLMQETPFELLPCPGSYFQNAVYSNISDEPDTDFTKRLIKEYGVASIPVSAFYSKGTDYKVIRFCFAKKEETLKLAAERLSKVKA